LEKDIKILVVDDTVTDRQILSKIIAGIENAELAGIAPNGRIALSKIAMKQPDLVLLDVCMPEMDGLETLSRIKAAYPHIDVVMISGIDQETAQTTVKALESGALDFVPKPTGPSPIQNMETLRVALSRLVSMARTRKYSRQARGLMPGTLQAPLPAPRSPAPVAHPAPLAPVAPLRPPVRSAPARRIARTPGRIDVVALGVSTGGPNALQELIPLLPGDLSVPILTVQHMPTMFTASLAARLDSVSAIRVVEAQDDDVIRDGTIYIAPGGRHMVVRRDRRSLNVIGLVDSPPVNSCRPSVDVLFRSVAMVYGGHVLTVILTGMGNDGMAGVAAIRRKGGYSLVQDEKTSVIWGMPGAIVEAELADEIVPLPKLAERITRVVQKSQA
jgi:two-component system, chemotaxis family, protein-glutamate methylesterase/glutaminase